MGAGFELKPFSRKQQQALLWWKEGSGHEHARIMMADGAIRSGKTIAMIFSFFKPSRYSAHNNTS